MKKKTLLLIPLLLVLLLVGPYVKLDNVGTSVRSKKNEVTINYSSNPEYNGGYVMPDLYNTGPITPKEKLVDFSVKYPDISCSDMCRIGPKQAEKYGYVFEGFTSTKTILINGASNVTLRDFYIDMSNTYGIRLVDWNNNGIPTNIVIEDGEITGRGSAAIIGSNVTIRRVYIHDYYADAIKISSNQIIESNYIASGGLGDGAHADGVQLTTSASNVKIYGNRFDMIGTFDNYKANANLFLQLESGEASNFQIAYNWLNGGGFTTYINEYEEGKFTDIKFLNNIFGNGRRFGYFVSNMTESAKSSAITGFDTFKYAEKLDVPFIGSVVYSSNNQRITDLKKVKKELTITINAANYTSNEQKIVLTGELYDYKNQLVKTYSNSNTIKRNMPGQEYVTNKGEILKKVSMSDFPQNIETTLKITDLPSDLSGYYMKIIVSKGDKILRTSQISNSIKKEYKLVDLSIKINKSTYQVGDLLKKDDFVVTALYSDGTSKVVNNYTFLEKEGLKLENNVITILYTEGKITINKKINIIVKESPSPSEKEQETSTGDTNKEQNDPSSVILDKDSNETIKDEENKTIKKSPIKKDNILIRTFILIILVISFIILIKRKLKDLNRNK